MTQANSTPLDAANAPAFQLQRVFLKGVSLEIPSAPEIFIAQGEIRLDFNVRAESSALEGNVHCVTLRSTLTAKLGDKTVYLLEMDQSGIFEVRNIPAEALPQLLEIHAPSVLTGYLRSNISDALSRATLPMFFLPDVDWVGLFNENQKSRTVVPAAKAPVAAFPGRTLQ